MRVAILGSGAVGGYYGACLARAGHEVTFIARGAHLDAIRARGLTVRGPAGAFTAPPRAESETSRVGPVALVIVAVKAYDNPAALPLIPPLLDDDTVVLTLQNGIESCAEIAAVAGDPRVLGGAAYIATALAAPGIVEQTGTHHRVVCGEVFGSTAGVTPRVRMVCEAFAGAGVEVEAARDARVPLWEKFVYLAPFAGLTGAARQPIGPLRSDPHTRQLLFRACGEVEAIGRAEGLLLPGDLRDRIVRYVDALPPGTRSSLLIDLQGGRRLEVEALQGAAVRRARTHGIDAPVMETLYAALRPHANGGG